MCVNQALHGHLKFNNKTLFLYDPLKKRTLFWRLRADRSRSSVSSSTRDTRVEGAGGGTEDVTRAALPAVAGRLFRSSMPVVSERFLPPRNASRVLRPVVEPPLRLRRKRSDLGVRQQDMPQFDAPGADQPISVNAPAPGFGSSAVPFVLLAAAAGARVIAADVGALAFTGLRPRLSDGRRRSCRGLPVRIEAPIPPRRARAHAVQGPA